jgi:hypothetical protein
MLLIVCGFDTRSTTSVFDIRVSYPDAPSYVNDTAEKLLEMGEKAKPKTYHTACALRSATFVRKGQDSICAGQGLVDVHQRPERKMGASTKGGKRKTSNMDKGT